MYLLGFSLLSIVFAFLVLLLPESPRWLIANGRVEEAIEVVTDAAIRYLLHKNTFLKQHSMNRRIVTITTKELEPKSLESIRGLNIC